MGDERHSVLLPITEEVVKLPTCQKCAWMSGSILPTCRAPENPEAYFDLILGLRIRLFFYCKDARESEEACGLIGRWFHHVSKTMGSFSTQPATPPAVESKKKKLGLEDF